MYSYEELRDRVFEDMSNLRRKYSGPDLQAQKISYLENMIETYSGQLIMDSDKNDRSGDFILGLRNMITDPANREVIYNFQQCKVEDVNRPTYRYQNIPSTISARSSAYKIMYIPMDIEVGRCLLTYTSGLVTFEYLEIADDFKSQIRVGAVVPDCVLVEFGFRAKVEYNKDFQGKKYQEEDVKSKVRGSVAHKTH